MPQWLAVVALAWVAGLSIPVGASLACIESIWPDWLETEFRHTLIAFGGGALLSAVALVLVPDGMVHQPLWLAALTFCAGGAAFMGLDLYLNELGASASQLVAMLADFVPEALALGAAFASTTAAGPLLALLIALQNLPEAFNAHRELVSATSLAPRIIILVLAAASLLGPAAGLAGYFWLARFPTAVAGLMLFAAGGILYLIFQDIAPQVRLERRWAPPLGAVAGFLVGMIGESLLH